MRILCIAGLITALNCSAQTFKTIYNFVGSPADGLYPETQLAVDRQGVLYGTTPVGGALDGGTVFSLTPSVAEKGKWSETVLYNFSPLTTYPSQPNPDLFIGPDGSLFGTTVYGGGYLQGTVFQLLPPSGGSSVWTEQTLYEFGEGDTNGPPNGGIILGADGRIYGAAGGGRDGYGVIYSLTPPQAVGGKWIEAVVHSFRGMSDGSAPVGRLALGQDHALYGATEGGGVIGNACPYGCGTVFRISNLAGVGGTPINTVLYEFGPDEGTLPVGSLVIGPQGQIYGTTSMTGAVPGGTIFELVPPSNGSSWTERVLFSFPTGDPFGPYPSPLTLGPDGSLFGTTIEGGTQDYGTVFRLVAPLHDNGDWAFHVMHNFHGQQDGGGPNGGVTLGNDNALYGTANIGGALGDGTVFRIER